MSNEQQHHSCWTSCPDCQGRGKKSSRLRKKDKLAYQKALEQFENSDQKGIAPTRPKAHLHICKTCHGKGIIPSINFPTPDVENYPHVAIIGGGIGGVALAVACLHRGIPFTLYERDSSFDARSQGYGLTLQQASKAIEGLGIETLKDGVISTKHVVHTPEGNVVGEWGIRKWLPSENKPYPKRTNIHIARQSLRLELINQLGGPQHIQWNHQLIDIQTDPENGGTLTFNVDGEKKTVQTDLIVGADGIRSTVRKQLIGEERTPLRYLGCIVILGICPLDQLKDVESSLLDSATVFQTANGNERIYMMPYDAHSVMWQLSFPMSEQEAKDLSLKGAQALKTEAQLRTPWHDPIPHILEATKESDITGYPVYDRELLNPDLLSHSKMVTLIGDAAHPMSPFKGQGANQALLDALSLARSITIGCRPQSNWREIGLKKSVLENFEFEMIQRTATKVKDSAAAAQFLHSDVVLHEGDEPRGRCLKKK